MNVDYFGPNSTNIHYHGLHTSPLIEDGGDSAPFLVIPPGASYQYTIDIPPDHWYARGPFPIHTGGSECPARQRRRHGGCRGSPPARSLR